MIYDVIIIGAGIIGISTAWQLQQRLPDANILLLEKENSYAKHQTGHNSGVIHAGVYYQPDSLKSKFCKIGLKATMGFCRQHDIKFDQCGKMLVATNDVEMVRMNDLFNRCGQNNIKAEILTKQELQRREPVITGMGGIFIADTGIVNYRDVSDKMAQAFIDLGGIVKLNSMVMDITENNDEIIVTTNVDEFKSKYLISCTGLMADHVVKMLGIEIDFQIIPFRGEYYQLPEKFNDIVKHLIYPISDPELPFLGVHLTRMIDGSVTVGPNAVLNLSREGYGKSLMAQVNITDIAQMLKFSGFWKLMRDNWRSGLNEAKNSIFKSQYLKLVQKYCPEITIDDLLPYPAGIRAQAVTSDGTLIHDFLFAESKRSINMANAPSPAATSAIPIGGYITDKAIKQFFS